MITLTYFIHSSIARNVGMNGCRFIRYLLYVFHVSMHLHASPIDHWWFLSPRRHIYMRLNTWDHSCYRKPFSKIRSNKIMWSKVFSTHFIPRGINDTYWVHFYHFNAMNPLIWSRVLYCFYINQKCLSAHRFLKLITLLQKQTVWKKRVRFTY